MIEWLVNKKVFKNVNHAIWFLSSVGFLLITISWYLFPGQRLILLIIPAVANLPPLITSIFVVYVKKENNEIYSSDCVWFNAFIIILYLLAYFFLD
ncbi:MAG: hypothetical protein D4Q79_01400 [Spirochaetia bacterium]|nr:MAG: hypothetical protein D4Q79_01400 [Spirochaetia bacterium]